MANNSILTECQGGYIPKKSTLNTVSTFTNDVLEGRNDNKLTLAMFVDFSKAFDTVNHTILLKKLKKYGIRGNFYQLLENYLANRSQTTIVNNLESSSKIIQFITKFSIRIPNENIKKC